MALTFIKLFQPTELAGTAGLILQCPSSPITTVLKNGRMRLTNTSASAVPVTLYAVPSGGSAGVGNEFMSAQSIAANSYLDVDIPTLAAGDTVTGFAGTASVIVAHELGGVLYS